ncbi:O-antigen ligase family protein [Sphingomonas sp. Xoc002]|uniref:O-antigen ligase family protein n=1 Tax=Sphingomonas sp. Xoc002 TaxID=2837624 RepID=UPI003D17F5FC
MPERLQDGAVAVTNSPWRRREDAHASRMIQAVGRYCIIPAAIIAIYRSTQMWYGYPTSQGDNALNDPFLMQLVLYSLVPLLALTTLALPRMAARAIVEMGPMVALLGVFLFGSIVTSVDPQISMRGLVQIIILALPMIYLRAFYGARGAFELLRKVMAVLLIVNFAYAAVFPHIAFMSGSLNGAMRGMFIHKNAFGAYCAMTFVMTCPPDINIRRWDRLAQIGLCGLAVVGAVLSKSSTAVVLLVVGTSILVLINILSRVEQRSIRAITFGGALAFAILLVGGAGTALLGEVAGQFGKDVTLSGRAEIWETLWPVALDKPWLGHGFAMFRQTAYFQQFTSSIGWGPRSTHNTYLEIALNCGFPALFAWLAIVLGCIFRAVLLVDVTMPDYRPLQKAVAGIVLVLLVSTSEAGQMLGPQPSWPILVLALYCIATAPNKRQRNGSVDRPFQNGGLTSPAPR